MGHLFSELMCRKRQASGSPGRKHMRKACQPESESTCQGVALLWEPLQEVLPCCKVGQGVFEKVATLALPQNAEPHHTEPPL